MIVRSAEIEALVRRLFSARASGDSDAVFDLFSESEHFLAVGSEEGEIWQGAEARALVANNWARLPEESDEVIRIEAYESGPVGWAAVEGKRIRPELPPYDYHFTVVLTLERGAWKVVSVHFSVLVPGDQVNRVDLTPSLSGLLASLQRSNLGTEGTSRTGTVMFTDVVDSTALSQRLGDEGWAGAIQDHMKGLRDVVDAHGGQMVKTLGDGGMFVFSSGASALGAAIDIQRNLARPSEDGIQIRIGIHTGDLLERERDLLGVTVHKAARVASAAGRGEILVSDTTVGIVNQQMYRLGDPMSVELKGLDGTHRLYAVDWSPADRDRRPEVDGAVPTGA